MWDRPLSMSNSLAIVQGHCLLKCLCTDWRRVGLRWRFSVQCVLSVDAWLNPDPSGRMCMGWWHGMTMCAVWFSLFTFSGGTNRPGNWPCPFLAVRSVGVHVHISVCTCPDTNSLIIYCSHAKQCLLLTLNYCLIGDKRTTMSWFHCNGHCLTEPYSP